MAEQFPTMRQYPIDRSILRAEKVRAEEGPKYSDQLQYSQGDSEGFSEDVERSLDDYSIEELGKMFDATTHEAYRLLERRENIRQIFNHKIAMANEMAQAIQEKFGERTGLAHMKTVSQGIDHRERF